ncbi:peptide transporter family 1-like isoform X2 [Sipha flava]|uniref:Oligopeptide transporter 1 n=1 Tax=Sipha flava TaxID=143950 RepID=A0A8B8G475_9HEMI|nr:peptide transporter family 1-like isoform X2 [Sipha flava]
MSKIFGEKYPKSVWFIVLNEFCERFNYYGLRTVLMLYLTTVLKFNGDDSTIIYHSFVFLAYFMPLLGAIIADSYWGKFKTIVRLSMVYAVGNVVLTGASMADMFTLDVQKIIALLGLFLICVGTGGIKPCVLAFGGDQFQLPQQQTQFQHYVTHFMIAINVGALISSFLTPELRHSVHCFGRNSCFPLAFGVPAVLMFTAIAVFFAGKNMYVKKKPGHNVIVRTFGCLFYALKTKLKSTSSCHHTHWLDHAKTAYTEDEISDTRAALNAITVFIGYPVFWALYEQQGSRWTLQAMLMNGRLNFLNWTIKPDQMQAVVPLFGLLFLFLFDMMLYPLLAKIGIRKPLQKLTLSGCLAIVAFLFAALLQMNIFGKSTIVPHGEGRINIYNGFDCEVYVRSPSLRVDHIRPLGLVNVTSTLISDADVVEIVFHFDPACTLVPSDFELNTALTVINEKEVSYYLSSSSPYTISLNRIGNYDNLMKDKYGNPSLRILTDHSFDYDRDNVSLISVDDDTNSINSYSLSSFREMDFNSVVAGRYNLISDGNTILTSINLMPATLYTLTLQRNGDKTSFYRT